VSVYLSPNPSFVVTTTPYLLTFGDKPRHVDIRGWHYGPRWLRVNDDDDDESHVPCRFVYICRMLFILFFRYSGTAKVT